MADEINNGLSPEVELELDGIDVNPTLDVSVDGLDVNPTLEMELQVEMGSRSSERNAEAWAVGERGGVPVSDTDQTYHNNSKYYAEQAGESAEAAETAASGAAAAVDKYPKIENGTWWVWDPVGAEWVDTEVPARGPQGNPGQGVPTGGTTGQILQKASGSDYDMEWGSVADPSVKADKVTGATSGNFAGLDANGNLTDSGKKPGDFITQHQDISGKADKVSNATSGNFAGLDSNGNLTDSGKKPSDFLTQHQDISGKADKVSNATSGNFAGLDSNGNLTDSGKKPSDFLTQHQDITGKADKVSGATSGNFAGLDSAGDLTDSGIGPDGIFYVQSGSGSAAQAYKKGDYILVAGSLSKALTDIASGASFTPANLAPAAAALCGVAERAEDTAGGIGWVEDTNTATHAISKGDYVLWKGSLCKASAAIAIGGTLSSSNLTAVSGGLGAEVASLSAHLENIGTIYTADESSTITTSNATWVTITTLLLTPGAYVITGDLTFNSNTNGIRIMILDTAESDVNLYDNSVLASGRADLSKTRIIKLNSATTIYLRSYQSSGGSLGVRGQIKAIRIS